MRSINTASLAIALLLSPIAVHFARAEDSTLALLVGCSKYPYLTSDTWLDGPSNDVAMWRDVLVETEGAGFSADSIVTLVGWPDDEARRPTRQNILNHLERMAAEAREGTRCFVLLSGHGSQVPQTVEDNEADGLDEVYLPADVSRESLKFIRDDEFARLFGAIADRGAHVWVVFDCCHSGSMLRGRSTGERQKFLPLTALGLPAIANVGNQQTWKKFASASFLDRDPGTSPAKRMRGSLVAFYAAQADETAPDMPLPEGVAHSKENYHGLLSFTINETLHSTSGKLTYNDVLQSVRRHYRAHRDFGPTPSAEGDLEAPVLAVPRWTDRGRMTVRLENGQLKVGHGSTSGLTPGSIIELAVSRDGHESVAGYARVASALPTGPLLEPTAWKSVTAIRLGDDSVFSGRVVRRETATGRRFKLYVQDDERLRRAVSGIASGVRQLFEVTTDQADAHWTVRIASEQGAAQAILTRGVNDSTGDKGWKSRTYTRYALERSDDFIASFERDLLRIHHWQSLWQLAEQAGASNGPLAAGVSLKVKKLGAKSNPADDRDFVESLAFDGEHYSVQVSNNGATPVWASVLYLDADLKITQIVNEKLRPGMDSPVVEGRFRTTGNSIGPEGLLAFLAPAPPDSTWNLAMLEQAGIGGEPVSTTKGISRPLPAFFLPAAPELPAHRGGAGQESPEVLSHCWLLLHADK